MGKIRMSQAERFAKDFEKKMTKKLGQRIQVNITKVDTKEGTVVMDVKKI